MAGIEDETMLDTDVVDFAGKLKEAFPNELRYAWNARLEHRMSTILHSSFLHAIPRCRYMWSRVMRGARGALRKWTLLLGNRLCVQEQVRGPQ